MALVMEDCQSLEDLEETSTAGLQVGDVVWAKVHKKGKYWPALVIDAEDCGQGISSHLKVWVYWFGDHRFTEVNRAHICDFKEEFHTFFRKSVGKGYDAGVVEAIRECGNRIGEMKSGLSRINLLTWAHSGFPENSEIFEKAERKKSKTAQKSGGIPTDVRQQLDKYRPTTEDRSDTESVSSLESDEEPQDFSQKLAMVKAINEKKIDLADVCLACLTERDDLDIHPLFNAFICSLCLTKFYKIAFSVGTDGNNYNCALCLNLESGLIFMCSEPDCFRSFCRYCLEFFFPINVRVIKRLEDWSCFMCTVYSPDTHGFVQPLYNHWRLNVWKLFHKCELEKSALRARPIRVLFTGGNTRSVTLIIQRLSEAQIKVSTIFISGFSEKDVALLTTDFQEKLVSLPSLWELDEAFLLTLLPIDIVVGGSRSMYSADPGDHKSLSSVCIFDDFHRTLTKVQKHTLVSPVFWLFEFEEPICAEFYGIVSRFLQFEPGKWRVSPSDIFSSVCVWTNVNALWTHLKADGVPHIKI